MRNVRHSSFPSESISALGDAKENNRQWWRSRRCPRLQLKALQGSRNHRIHQIPLLSASVLGSTTTTQKPESGRTVKGMSVPTKVLQFNSRVKWIPPSPRGSPWGSVPSHDWTVQPRPLTVRLTRRTTLHARELWRGPRLEGPPLSPSPDPAVNLFLLLLSLLSNQTSHDS